MQIPSRFPCTRLPVLVMTGVVAFLLVAISPASAQKVIRVYGGGSQASPSASSAPTPQASGSKYEQVYYGDETYMATYRRVIRSYNRSLSDEQLETIVRSILYYSYVFRIDPRFVVAVVAIESAFRPHAVSPAGAGGLGQLMPATARDLKVDPHVPWQNIQGTVRYLKLNLDRFQHLSKLQRYRMCLASYNAGYGAVQQYGGIPPYQETVQYVRMVMNEYGKLSGER